MLVNNYFFRIALTCACLFVLCSTAYAEDVDSEVQDAKQLTFSSASSNLPKPNDKQERFFISSRNEQEFRDYLLAPIGKLLFQGKLAFRAFSELGFSFTVSDEWEEGSRANPLIYELNAANMATFSNEPAAPLPKLGFPFGFASDIESEADPRKKAYKILWNTVYTQGKAPKVQYSYEMAWIGAQSFLRKATATVYREFYRTPEVTLSESTQVSPKNVEAVVGVIEKEVSANVQDLQLKELFQFSFPPAVKNLSQVTWRSRDNKEDLVWIYSPVVGRSRRVLQSNRSDPILGSLLSYNDLFVFSEKIQSFDAQVVGAKTILALFPSHLPYQFGEERVVSGAEDGGLASLPADAVSAVSNVLPGQSTLAVNGEYIRHDASRVSVLWNYETRQYPQASAWVPTSAFAVPRNVWIIELNPTDPFHAYGKILLAVDQESMLPLIKIVYDKRGNHRKIIFAGWNLARTKEGNLNFPILSFLLSVDPNGEKAIAFVMQSIRIFKDNTKPQISTFLDIENHGKDVMEDLGEEQTLLDQEESSESKDQFSEQVVEPSQVVSEEAESQELEEIED